MDLVFTPTQNIQETVTSLEPSLQNAIKLLIQKELDSALDSDWFIDLVAEKINQTFEIVVEE
tara:strand:- start:469 stop:654 length:186 start_codon:yes stop_codon:yes gene_type:complete